MPIQDFDFTTQKTSNIKEKHAIVSINNETDLNILDNVLKKSGYRILGSTDQGSEAIELVRKHKIGLFFLDYDIIALGNSAVLDKVKIKFPKIKVIVIATKLDKNEVKEAKQHGVLGFLAKPVSEEAIVKLLSKSNIAS